MGNSPVATYTRQVRPALDIVAEDPATKADDQWNREHPVPEQNGGPSKSRALHDRPFRSAVRPCWSRNGKLLATHLGIWRVEDDKRLIHVRSLRNGALPVGFSPDGKEFAYLKYLPSDPVGGLKGEVATFPDLWIVSVQGKREKKIADNVISATWSPTGDWFAVVQLKDTSLSKENSIDSLLEKSDNLSLLIIDRKGRRKGELAGAQLPAGGRGAWSPDGTRFTDGGNVWIVPSDPAKARLALPATQEARSAAYGGPGELASQTPRWSADGKFVLMVYSGPGPGFSAEYLVAVNADTGVVTPLREHAYLDPWGLLLPSDWSPDGSRLAVSVDHNPSADSGMGGYGAMGVSHKPNLANMTGVWVVGRDGKRCEAA